MHVEKLFFTFHIHNKTLTSERFLSFTSLMICRLSVLVSQKYVCSYLFSLKEGRKKGEQLEVLICKVDAEHCPFKTKHRLFVYVIRIYIIANRLPVSLSYR